MCCGRDAICIPCVTISRAETVALFDPTVNWHLNGRLTGILTVGEMGVTYKELLLLRVFKNNQLSYKIAKWY